MATICNRCDGVIKDISFGTEDRCDCNNHTKIELDVEVGEKKYPKVTAEMLRKKSYRNRDAVSEKSAP